MFVRLRAKEGIGNGIVSQTAHFHARQAAAALLRMAKLTAEPGVAARLVEAAAALKDQAGELPPPIVPHGADQDTYLVLEDFGLRGQVWRESADRETLIRDLLDGQFSNPVRIVAFNTSEGWCRDVTIDIADELRRRFVEQEDAPEWILDFMDANRR